MIAITREISDPMVIDTRALADIARIWITKTEPLPKSQRETTDWANGLVRVEFTFGETTDQVGLVKAMRKKFPHYTIELL